MINTTILLGLLLGALPILYGVAFFDYLLAFVTEDRTVRKLARPLLMTAVSVNLLYVLGFTVFFEHIPMVNVYQAVGMVGFALAAIYLWVESRTQSLHTGPFVLFLVLIFQLVSTLFPKLDREVPEILRSTLFSVHVSAAVVGYSALALSGVFGVLYLMMYYRIRQKSFGLIFRRLPPLDVLDRMNVAAAMVGFGFLTLAIAVGSVWTARLFGDLGYMVRDPKILVALLTWVVYAVALGGRWLPRWSGTHTAYSTTLGFAAVLFSIFAVNFLLSRFHVFTS
jgi:ABC-type transport system involved in cytochrome c biogenesis permease subunit